MTDSTRLSGKNKRKVYFNYRGISAKIYWPICITLTILYVFEVYNPNWIIFSLSFLYLYGLFNITIRKYIIDKSLILEYDIDDISKKIHIKTKKTTKILDFKEISLTESELSNQYILNTINDSFRIYNDQNTLFDRILKVSLGNERRKLLQKK